MIRKIIVALLCALFIASFVLAGFALIYFSLPSRRAKASIELAESVEDPTLQEAESIPEEKTETEEDTNTYVADVHNSLSLRQTPDSGDDRNVINLPPMTHMLVENVVPGNKSNQFAYVTVSSGEYEGSKGYVNADYITKLGEETKRVVYDEQAQ